jgi:dUTP pyrophosphatase
MTTKTAERLIEVPIIVPKGSSLPCYASSGASGADMTANIETPLVIEPGKTCLVPSGLQVAIPEGYEIQVRPRSGLALKSGLTVLNTPGTIDADYRGKIGVIMINHSDQPFTVTPGMRIAQLVVTPVVQARFVLSESLDETVRGAGAFGHTGTH